MGDLDAALDKLDWANAQITVIGAELATYIDRQPYRLVREPDVEDSSRDAIIVHETEFVPRNVVTSIGMTVAAIRDSLDYLVYALAERNGAVDPRHVQFPICESMEKFQARENRKRLAGLSANDIDLIGQLKPYKGGNDLLYALHWLNVKGKHRKPLLVARQPDEFLFKGPGHIGAIALYVPRRRPDGSYRIATVKANPEYEFELTFYVGFEEPDEARGAPIAFVLWLLSKTAREIIQQFILS